LGRRSDLVPARHLLGTDLDAEECDNLQGTAVHFVLLALDPGLLPTPKQQAGELRKVLTVLEQALALLPLIDIGHDCATSGPSR